MELIKLTTRVPKALKRRLIKEAKELSKERETKVTLQDIVTEKLHKHIEL